MGDVNDAGDVEWEIPLEFPTSLTWQTRLWPLTLLTSLIMSTERVKRAKWTQSQEEWLASEFTRLDQVEGVKERSDMDQRLFDLYNAVRRTKGFPERQIGSIANKVQRGLESFDSVLYPSTHPCLSLPFLFLFPLQLVFEHDPS